MAQTGQNNMKRPESQEIVVEEKREDIVIAPDVLIYESIA